MLKINTHYQKLPGSYLFTEINQRVSRFLSENPRADLIKMGIGDVTKPLCPAVINAMHAAVNEMAEPSTFHGYGPEFGYLFLIDAIIANDYKPLNISLSADEVFISDGAKSDVANLQELFSKDTVVAVCDPVYPVYVDSNIMAGRAGKYCNEGKWSKIVYLPLTRENHFIPDLPKRPVDVIYLCYPNNPTGTVLTKPQLAVWVEYARQNNALIIFDAAYHAYIRTEGVPHSIYEIDGAKEVAIECRSFSKTAGFTGTRCAFTVIPREVCGIGGDRQKVSLNHMWRRRTSTKFNGVSYVVQKGAEAVFTKEGKIQIKDTIDYYMENAGIIRTALTKLGFDTVGGVDAPYIWAKIPGDDDSWDFFDKVLRKCRVIGTPGDGFGPSGKGYFRFTAFNTKENTIRAMDRLSDL